MAQDKGYPPLSRTVEVQIDVVDRANNPPVWDHTIYGPIYVKENMPVGGKVVSVKARSVESVETIKSFHRKTNEQKKAQIKFVVLVCLCKFFAFVLSLRFSIPVSFQYCRLKVQLKYDFTIKSYAPLAKLNNSISLNQQPGRRMFPKSSKIAS